MPQDGVNAEPKVEEKVETPGQDNAELVVEVAPTDAAPSPDPAPPVVEEPQEKTVSHAEHARLQTAHTRSQEDNKRLRGLLESREGDDARMTRLEDGLGLVVEHLPGLRTSVELNEFNPAPIAPAQETDLERRRREWAAGGGKSGPSGEFQRAAGEFRRQAVEAGVGPQTEGFTEHFAEDKHPSDSLAKLPAFIEQFTQGKAAKEEAGEAVTKDREKLVALEAENAALKTSLQTIETHLGLNTVDTSGPAGQGGGGPNALENLNAAFRRQEITEDEFKERSAEIKKQQQGG